MYSSSWHSYFVHWLPIEWIKMAVNKLNVFFEKTQFQVRTFLQQLLFKWRLTLAFCTLQNSVFQPYIFCTLQNGVFQSYTCYTPHNGVFEPYIFCTYIMVCSNLTLAAPYITVCSNLTLSVPYTTVCSNLILLHNHNIHVTNYKSSKSSAICFAF